MAAAERAVAAGEAGAAARLAKAEAALDAALDQMVQVNVVGTSWAGAC